MSLCFQKRASQGKLGFVGLVRDRMLLESWKLAQALATLFIHCFEMSDSECLAKHLASC